MTKQEIKALSSVLETLLLDRKEGIYLKKEECAAIAVFLNWLLNYTD